MFRAINDEVIEPPRLSNENLLINELIREYLAFNEYKHTSSTLVLETGMSEQPLSRHFMAEELNIHDSQESAKVPLLYGILAYLRSNHNQQ